MMHTPEIDAAHAAIDLQEIVKYIDRLDLIEYQAANLASLIHLISHTDDLDDCVAQALNAVGDLAYKLKTDATNAARGFSSAMGQDA